MRLTAAALALLCAVSAHAAETRPSITGVSHIAVYSSAPDRTERFYVHDLGGVKGQDPENPQGVRYYFARTQFVEVLPLPAGPASINRLDHVAFITTDAEALRKYLGAKQIAVPKQLAQGRDGSRWFDVTDPEGNKIELVQPSAQAAEVAANPLSSHIIHVGFIVHDRAREDGFFRTVLGFKPYWFGGMKDDTPTWVSQQVPDGTDWLEYMLNIKPDADAHLRGGMNHFSLGIAKMSDAVAALARDGCTSKDCSKTQVGRDGKVQMNVYDPDLTRIEFMEFRPSGTICCSEFKGTHPTEVENK